MKLSICIVTDSQKELLKDCLESIYKFKPKCSFEIWVVDNASENKIFKMVQKNFPSVKLIVNKEKYGFSKNNNLALRRCSGEYILILNDDTLILNDAINKMIKFIDEREDIGAAGLKQYYRNRKVQYITGRNLPSLETYIYRKLFLDKLFPKSKIFGKLNMSYWDHLTSREVKALSGACMFVRNEVLEKVGYFDENFKFYYEDIDLCRRFGESGFKLYYNTDCEIMHFQGMSIGRRMKARGKIEEFRSAVYYFKKYGELKYYWLMKFLDIFSNILKIPVFLFINPYNSYEFMKVVIWHLRHLKRESVLRDS